MNINDAFPTKYFKADQLDRPVTLVIERFQMEEMNNPQTGRKEIKPVIYFVGEEQGLVLNLTKKDVLEQAFGSETDDYIGREITLSQGRTKFGGKTIPCIDVSIPAPVKQGRSAGNAPYNPKVGPNPAMAQTVAGLTRRNGPPEPPPVESEDDYGN